MCSSWPLCQSHTFERVGYDMPLLARTRMRSQRQTSKAIEQGEECDNVSIVCSSWPLCQSHTFERVGYDMPLLARTRMRSQRHTFKAIEQGEECDNDVSGIDTPSEINMPGRRRVTAVSTIVCARKKS